MKTAAPSQYHTVHYEWSDATGTHHGHTVVTSNSQKDAERSLQRRNPHVKVTQTPTP